MPHLGESLLVDCFVMPGEHFYDVQTTWAGASNGPANNYQTYSRRFVSAIEGKSPIEGSADPNYRGDKEFVNPEELLVASIASCHLLSYLALCVRKGITVISYVDEAHGVMQISDGKMRVTDVVLRPIVEFAEGSDLSLAADLHEVAHRECFIANSVKVDIRVEPVLRIKESSTADA